MQSVEAAAASAFSSSVNRGVLGPLSGLSPSFSSSAAAAAPALTEAAAPAAAAAAFGVSLLLVSCCGAEGGSVYHSHIQTIPPLRNVRITHRARFFPLLRAAEAAAGAADWRVVRASTLARASCCFMSFVTMSTCVGWFGVVWVRLRNGIGLSQKQSFITSKLAAKLSKW